MKLEIRVYGDPVLRTKGKRVARADERIRRLADDMIDTMHAANGVGLAAQQIGEALQLTVLDVSQAEDRPSTLKIDGRALELEGAMPLILLNPEAALGEELVSGTEGCLSFPEISAEIDRPESVRVRAETLGGSPILIEATGLLARALQHEIDHLNGVLFIDRMSSGVRAGLSGRLKRLQKEANSDRARAPGGPSDQRVL
jgi:peptide deformylase